LGKKKGNPRGHVYGGRAKLRSWSLVTAGKKLTGNRRSRGGGSHRVKGHVREKEKKEQGESRSHKCRGLRPMKKQRGTMGSGVRDADKETTLRHQKKSTTRPSKGRPSTA